MSGRPNIVLITVDQMRADCLGVEGHPVVETPNLDYMAREGVRFSAAYSAVPSCIAARAAILTGLSQVNHGRVGYRMGYLGIMNVPFPENSPGPDITPRVSGRCTSIHHGVCVAFTM